MCVCVYGVFLYMCPLPVLWFAKYAVGLLLVYHLNDHYELQSQDERLNLSFGSWTEN